MQCWWKGTKFKYETSNFRKCRESFFMYQIRFQAILLAEIGKAVRCKNFNDAEESSVIIPVQKLRIFQEFHEECLSIFRRYF